LYSLLLNQLITWSGLHDLFPTYGELAETLFNTNVQMLSYIGVAILAPILEELIYRGLVYRRLRDYLTVRAAAVISAAVFGLIHGNVVQFIFAFLVGLAFAAVYERYRTIWAPILAHVFVNAFSCVLTFAEINFVPANDITAVLVFAIEGMLVVILGVMTLKKWAPKSKAASESQE
jgi:membrane protease YdiL (CAAX protease family)